MQHNSEKVIFDDWIVRNPTYYKSRIKELKFLIYMLLVVDVFVCVLFIFSLFEEFWYAFIPWIVIFLFTTIMLYLNWLNIKNRHLIIKPTSIEITNCFNKTITYNVNYKECSIELENDYLVFRSIKLTFIDAYGSKVCRYGDLINHPSYLGTPLNDWEKTLASLGVPLVDKSCVFKNNLYQR